MQRAENILKAMRKLGEKGIALDRIYRNLYEPELYLMAYGKLSKNTGAMTPGTTKETVDGMRIEKIQAIIEQLKQEKYNFQPVKRVYIPKPRGYGQRPLGLPTFSDKLVQEVVRMLLEAYYEPRFSIHSHGFRPGRGCHTALKEIKKTFTGTVWYVEMDIKGCFDNINHERLLEILEKKIKDGRLLNLIRRMLEAGYLEDWTAHNTYSGTPQGGIISPLLANIYLDQLDRFVTTELQPAYTKGELRKQNKAYKRIYEQVKKARAKGNKEQEEKGRKIMRQMPTQETHDPDYKRLKYVRYADDSLIGIIGTRQDAEAVKEKLATFLGTDLQLTLSQEKTLITHARSESAKFLGYLVSTYQSNDKLTRNEKRGGKTRSVNGQQRLSIPMARIDECAKKYMREGKHVSLKQRTLNSVPEIIDSFQTEYRGIAEYYKYASNRAGLSKLKFAMEGSLVKTLAQKLRIKVTEVYRRYRTKAEIDGQQYTVLRETLVTEKGTYHFTWGGISLKVQRFEQTSIDDFKPKPTYLSRTELVSRLLANVCEQCGSTENIEVHHVRKLSDLAKRWKDREKPAWVEFMITRQRKTIVLCRECHEKVHKQTFTDHSHGKKQ